MLESLKNYSCYEVVAKNGKYYFRKEITITCPYCGNKETYVREIAATEEQTARIENSKSNFVNIF